MLLHYLVKDETPKMHVKTTKAMVSMPPFLDLRCISALSTLTLLVEHQEGHPACKNPVLR